MTERAGRCACGAVTATIAADPVAVRQCWCRQCQQLSAGSPTNNAIFPTDAVALAGPLDTWSYVAASGSTLTHSRCATCGTPVKSQSSFFPQFTVVRLGFLDVGHGLRPTAAIWTDEAHEHALIDPEIERHPRQPVRSRPTAENASSR